MLRPVRSLLMAVEKVIDRALCVAGAVLFSQAPEFMQQYLQRLGGHLDEARRQLQRFRDVAAQGGLTLDQWTGKMMTGGDPNVARLGNVVRETSARVDTLAADEAAIRHASLFVRPFVFLRHADPRIVRATLAVFRPAVPTTLEGLAYAVAGMVLLLLFYHGAVRQPVRRIWLRGFTRRNPAQRGGDGPSGPGPGIS